jgi:two-component system sensor histidine kinase DegS
MRNGPYTPSSMDAARGGSEPRDSRFDALYAEAKAALGYGANTLRSVTERYREAYRDSLARWHRLRDEMEAIARAPAPVQQATSDPAAAAEAGAEDARQRAVRSDADRLTSELGHHQTELSKLELSVRSMENAWLFLERGDASLLAEVANSGLPTDMQMRIVQAQEAERSRLAQEIHDGPAQALSNAIFQVEYIERVMDEDARMAGSELRFLRELLRRELGEVRTFISQLRPPLLDDLGLDGAILDAVETMKSLTETTIETELTAPAELLNPTQQTAVLRITQEALQNIRKHAAASRTLVATKLDRPSPKMRKQAAKSRPVAAAKLGQPSWILEVTDDGRGFDVSAVAARGRRNFGLQFMRERAELIGAQFEVHSRPGGGTVVRLAIPVEEESA